ISQCLSRFGSRAPVAALTGVEYDRMLISGAFGLIRSRQSVLRFDRVAEDKCERYARPNHAKTRTPFRKALRGGYANHCAKRAGARSRRTRFRGDHARLLP